jgi:hypothetical protein
MILKLVFRKSAIQLLYFGPDKHLAVQGIQCGSQIFVK